MKKLENYGVQTLNAKEIREIDGGFLGIDDGILAVVALTITVLNADWDQIGDDLSKGWNSL